MASIDALPLFPLARDIAGCMALSTEAGWNQTPDDWALFFDRGTVFGLRDPDGHPVATGAILPYGGAFAWISMVLVTAAHRRARLGTRILKMCCTELTQRRLVAVLDATPAGEQVYRPLGFEPLFGLTRWQGAGGGQRPGMQADIRPMRGGDLAAIAEIDTAAFGAPRSFLLDSFYRRAPQLAFKTDSADGFALARPGRIATQIGPIVGADEDTAAALLGAALDAAAGPIFLDLCDRWSGLRRQLERRGFTVQRPFLRMALRHSVPFGDAARTFVVAGPEFG
jgi:GNAT acetyltransferase-like protein/acetyltransferase (GNAT) family protein